MQKDVLGLLKGKQNRDHVNIQEEILKKHKQNIKIDLAGSSEKGKGKGLGIVAEYAEDVYSLYPYTRAYFGVNDTPGDLAGPWMDAYNDVKRRMRSDIADFAGADYVSKG